MGGHLLALVHQFIQAAHLNRPQGGAHLIQAVVVTQVSVLQPGITGGASLVAQCAH